MFHTTTHKERIPEALTRSEETPSLNFVCGLQSRPTRGRGTYIDSIHFKTYNKTLSYIQWNHRHHHHHQSINDTYNHLISFHVCSLNIIIIIIFQIIIHHHQSTTESCCQPSAPPPPPQADTMSRTAEESSSSLHTLVTQTLVDTSKYYCPFLDRGFCRETSRCNFSHDNHKSTKIPTDYCHFYLANQCLYGQDCKFLHSEPNYYDGNKDLPLCPYSLASGECPFPEGQCNYLHGETCDLCYSPCLHPFNDTQRRLHRDECLREHEREMELSFAVQRSKDKVCGICMDTVVEKKPITASRFGILEKCNHIFCLDCIRKWRGTKQFDSRTIRACPECRVSSDFVVPSKYWIEDQDDKEKLIQDYKAALKYVLSMCWPF